MGERTVLDTLAERGLIDQVTHDAPLRAWLATPGRLVYIGFDPTAPSLHVGSLLPILVLAHLQRDGHRPVALVGGATGMIGDPSGRSAERNLLTPDQVAVNLAGIRSQLAAYLDFTGPQAAVMVNNADWVAPMGVLDWLRDVGKHFSVNSMMAKESVRRRLEDRERGISYAEFSYMLIQAFDFLHLFGSLDCRVQAGGSDQWGNITAGIDLIRRVRGGEAYGFTFPLVTTAAGEKFGKSAGNAVWISPDLTSPYRFYQYWMQADDRDVERYLKLFTFLPLGEITSLVAAHAETPGRREAQRVLAAEVTRTVHGAEGLERARRASEVLFGREIEGLTDAELDDIFADVPSTRLSLARLIAGLPLIDLLAETGLCPSKAEARRTTRSGGVYINNRKPAQAEPTLTPSHLCTDRTLVVRLGKRNYHVVRFTGEI